MKMQVRLRGLRKSFGVIACLLLIFSLMIQHAAACSWDYLIWINRSKSADPLYRFLRNGKAGYIDRTGKIVVQPTLKAYGNYGGEFHDGLLEIDLGQGRYVDMNGNPVIDKGFHKGQDFSEGLAAAIPGEGKKWGYIDRTGEFVIRPQFDIYPDSFSEGLASIVVSKRFGYINSSGEIVIQPRFLHATDFHEGLARVVIEGPCTYYGGGPCPGGQTLGAESQEPVSACKFTFIDKSGSVITTERYDSAKDFSEGFAPVRLGEKWGYIDQKGSMVIEPRFDEAWPFSEGLALVKQGNRYGYIDQTGAFSILPQFDYAEGFSDGLAVVGHWNEKEFKHDEYYYINKQGAQAIPEKFAVASSFFKGLAHVRLKSNRKRRDKGNSKGEATFSYIETTGKKVFTYKYKLD